MVGPGVLVFALLASCLYGQTELQENVRYEGGTQISISSLGVTFPVPPGWHGGVTPGSPYMVLADNTNEVTIIILADEMKEAEILGQLQQKMSIDEGISIEPVGKVQREAQRWWGEYKVIGADDMKCYAEIRLGSYNIGVGCIVLSLPSASERGKNAAFYVLDHMSFRSPQTNTAVLGLPDKPYQDYLKVKSLRYSYSQGDFTDTDLIHLCSNGTYKRSKESHPGSASGSATTHETSEGTWEATGQGAEGILILHGKNGARNEFKLQYRSGAKGVGLYLNGYRYFIEDNNQCR